MSIETAATRRRADGPDRAIPEFGWALTVLLREWNRGIEAAVGDLPYGTRGYGVLAAVVEEEHPTQAALAARLGVDRSTMTYLIDEYAALGLVERRHDPADRRVRRIVPTERGRALLAELDARARAAEENLLSALPEPDRRRLRRLLVRLAESVPHDPDHCGTAARVM
jgi:MarR family transcriptional regulator for hemolysin